jgi:Adenylate kinase and related kinases
VTRLVLMGPPGCGKGTQGALLSAMLGVPHVSTGEMLRSEIASGSKLGVLAGSLIDRGEFVPDDVITGIVLGVLSRDAARGGYILDGYPRTLPQARVVLEHGAADAVVAIAVPDEALAARVAARASAGRADDTPETFATRMRIYRERTAPVTDLFREAGLLVEVDGTAPPEAVAAAILRATQAEPEPATR